MKETLQELGKYIASSLSGHDLAWEERGKELIVTAPRDSLFELFSFLHDDSHCMFRQLMDITGLDFPEDEERFCVVYNLLSLKHNQRIRVKVYTSEDVPVPSLVKLYPTAGWFEREVWDMFGVFFSGNPDLRRILTDYGFDGHPLRKDFPLTGYVEMRYDPEQERVIYEPVKLNQAFRNFDFLSPWEGAEYVLPGDEKAAEPAHPEKKKAL